MGSVVGVVEVRNSSWSESLSESPERSLAFKFFLFFDEDTLAVKIIFDVKRKKVNYKTVIECVKVSNIFIGLKKTFLGVLE